MPLARKRQISLIDTPYYHCMSRCVRRAFLCGEDTVSGKSYDHRRQWVEDRLLFLGKVFCVDICAYAVMSNHTHLVLHVDQEKATSLSDQEVATRWLKIHKATYLVQRFCREGEGGFTEIERQTLRTTLAIYQQRLFNISWFMRELNEFIARQANLEDECTGHFWEGRFKSQALLDDNALAACLVYLDLNPVRAKLASSPETSEHTSIKRRMMNASKGYQPSTLLPFVGRQNQCRGLSFCLNDYLNLVKASARIFTTSNRNGIETNLFPHLKRIGFSNANWQVLVTNFEDNVSVAAGNIISLEKYKSHTKRKRLPSKKWILW